MTSYKKSAPSRPLALLYNTPGVHYTCREDEKKNSQFNARLDQVLFIFTTTFIFFFIVEFFEKNSITLLLVLLYCDLGRKKLLRSFPCIFFFLLKKDKENVILLCNKPHRPFSSIISLPMACVSTDPLSIFNPL